MITDIHCHFIPDEYFKRVQARDEFEVRLIGADGESSTVRRQLFGPGPGRHAGYVVWRGQKMVRARVARAQHRRCRASA